MDSAELLALLSPTGLDLLDGLPPYDPGAVVATVSDLRARGHAPEVVSAVLGQSRLRARARPKFGEFADRMLFTEAGLEQATRLGVAAHHARRFRDAGIAHVVDLGCGIGGDALAFAALELQVTAVERDEVTAAVASFNLAPFPEARVVQGDAETTDPGDAGGAFLDPARRTSGHSRTRRLADPADWSPSLDLAFGLGERLPTGVKLGPGIDRELLPDGWEWQWISVDREVVEAGVWSGPLARPGVGRSALVVGASGAAAELTGAADAEDAPVRELGTWLYEPDGAVIRARLIGDLARDLGAGMLSTDIAYLTADERVETPFAQAFRVVEAFPLDERTLRKELRTRGIGRLEVKKRGVDVDPAAFRTRMQLRGTEQATLVLTRVAGRHTALLCERARA